MDTTNVKKDAYVPWAYYSNWAQKIKDFEVRDSDIIVAGHPKSGTTWIQELVWLIATDLNFEGAKKELTIRFPMFDYCQVFDENAAKLPNRLPDYILDSINYINHQQSPRFYKIHMPFWLLPEQIRNGSKKPKIIAIARNAKDVCVSFYYFLKGMEKKNDRDLITFCQQFLESKIGYGNIPYWTRVLSYWEQRHLDNLLFVKYEDMKADLTSTIKQVAEFLGKTITDEQVKLLESHLSFEAMKKNKATNFKPMFEKMGKLYETEPNVELLRCGKVNSYKNELSPEMIQQFDEWTRNSLEGTGLTY